MRAVPIIAALLLAACGPLVQIGGNDKAPTALLTLRATAAPLLGSVGAARADAVLVLLPATAGTLQTLRLPVITSDTSLAYLTGATWAEQPNRQVQRLLADTLEARGIVALDPRQAPLASGRTLTSTLVECGLDVRNPASAVVRVRLDAVLAAKVGGQVLSQRFEVTEPVSTQLPGDVAAALNVAANRMAGEVATWVKR